MWFLLKRSSYFVVVPGGGGPETEFQSTTDEAPFGSVCERVRVCGACVSVRVTYVVQTGEKFVVPSFYGILGVSRTVGASSEEVSHLSPAPVLGSLTERIHLVYKSRGDDWG